MSWRICQTAGARLTVVLRVFSKLSSCGSRRRSPHVPRKEKTGDLPGLPKAALIIYLIDSSASGCLVLRIHPQAAHRSWMRDHGQDQTDDGKWKTEIEKGLLPSSPPSGAPRPSLRVEYWRMSDENSSCGSCGSGVTMDDRHTDGKPQPGPRQRLRILDTVPVPVLCTSSRHHYLSHY